MATYTKTWQGVIQNNKHSLVLTDPGIMSVCNLLALTTQLLSCRTMYNLSLKATWNLGLAARAGVAQAFQTLHTTPFSLGPPLEGYDSSKQLSHANMTFLLKVNANKLRSESSVGVFTAVAWPDNVCCDHIENILLS